MRWVALPAGIVILLWTLLDVFRTLVMPRAALQIRAIGGPPGTRIRFRVVE